MPPRSLLFAASSLVVGLLTWTTVGAQPDPSLMAGVPLPASDLPAGAVSVRVIRGGFANNVAEQPVEFLIDGRPQIETTDASGRAQISGLTAGARVRAFTTMDGQRLETQEMTMGGTGFRVVLYAPLPVDVAPGPSDARVAGPGPELGTVELGGDTRIVASFENDRLEVFYALQLVNSSQAPVDPGGPIVLDLPRTARGASVLERSSTQATMAGTRLIVTGPFAPGTTDVQIAYELPYTGGTATLDQQWPVRLSRVTLFLPQRGGLGVTSPQFAFTQQILEQGQPVVVATGPPIAAGDVLSFEITGLPHHPLWPRYLALTLAAVILVAGVWVAATARPARGTA